MIETETERRTPSRNFAARCDEVFDTPGTFARLEERLHDLPYPASFRPFAGYEPRVVLSERSLLLSDLPLRQVRCSHGC
jgi:hypothetical protein